MSKLYVASTPEHMAYVLVDGGEATAKLPPGYSRAEAEYISIIFGLTEYYNRWSKELDARQYDLDTETGEYYKVATPSDETPRPLPSSVMICCSSEIIVKQLSRQNHIANNRLRDLAKQVWSMSRNVDVKFEWATDNPAEKLLL